MPPPRGAVAIGEIGLAGELRRVRDLPQRIAEAVAARLQGGGRPPRAGVARASAGSRRRRMVDGLRVVEVDDVVGALLTLDLTPPL